uniref:Uncharacterized protein n=1 Tax=Meloidogyne incognita TaxID=6306 RepID=A0A914LYE8_MELIC
MEGTTSSALTDIEDPPPLLVSRTPENDRRKRLIKLESIERFVGSKFVVGCDEVLEK